MVFCSINEWCVWACSHITAVMASNELAAVRIISAFLLFSLSVPISCYFYSTLIFWILIPEERHKQTDKERISTNAR